MWYRRGAEVVLGWSRDGRVAESVLNRRYLAMYKPDSIRHNGRRKKTAAKMPPNRTNKGKRNIMKGDKKMGKVDFEAGIESLKGKVQGDDPYYVRRYRCRNGRVIHIVQACPDRSGHKATPTEAANRKAFGKRYGTGRKKFN